MKINEPLTLATDYILAIASIIFATLLWRRAARWWALTFVFTAAGSFFGGTYHGFGGQGWWKATVYSIGLASLFLVLAASAGRFGALKFAATLGFVAYAVWMVNHDKFLYVIVCYGTALVILTILQFVRWTSGSPWIIGSVVVSVAGAIVQQAPIPYHNDIYHAIQLIGLWLLFRGGAATTLAIARSMSQPT